MTKSLYKVSPSGEVGGAEAETETWGRVRVEGQPIELRREEARRVSAGVLVGREETNDESIDKKR